jgi:hypothetical protein
MKRITPVATLGAAALLSACATTPRPSPVDVTRFHLGAPVQPGTTAIEPLSTNARVSPEYQSFADAVAAELARLGYAPGSAQGTSAYIAEVAFVRESRGFVRKRSPVTIGVGGGSFGGNVGVGGGASFGIGGGSVEIIATELRVQLRRRSDNSVVWEGRASAEAAEAGAPAGATAQRLAKALFRDFPGESGITITVK